MQTVNLLIANCISIIGASTRNLPDDESHEFLVREVQKHLIKYTPEQVKEALYKAIKGEFKFDYKLYDNYISVAWFVELMSKYDQWKKSLSDYKPKPAALIDYVPTPEERIKITKEALTNVFNTFKKHGMVITSSPWVYNLIKDSVSLTPKEEAKLLKRAEEMYKAQLEVKRQRYRGSNIANIIADIDIGNYGEHESMINQNYYDLVVINFFEGVVKMEMDILDVIEIK